MPIIHELQVSALGDTVWVNGPDGSSIGRFSKRFGIDVHTTATAQMDGESQCLFCTHGAAGAAEWGAFRRAVLKHHGIDIPANLISFS
ncbi:hypothetical protein A9R05_43180 (plasmid) [Burkholderia sp. KK1]|uniref:hypothetical protein n=1 Tax=Burkholderia TaxID=32008 RepID=UPI000979C1FA|nr:MULTISPECIES: hypothetical protein [Burkholderia]AQH05819.1 hypothetical protein A9R05_43180 [Burkholderia sp. KK1]